MATATIEASAAKTTQVVRLGSIVGYIPPTRGWKAIHGDGTRVRLLASDHATMTLLVLVPNPPQEDTIQLRRGEWTKLTEHVFARPYRESIEVRVVELFERR